MACSGYDLAMDPLTHTTLRRVLDRARRDPDVLAVILFGSHARGEASVTSDVDLCLVLASDRIENLPMSVRGSRIWPRAPRTS